jgi:hypothetical protein
MNSESPTQQRIRRIGGAVAKGGLIGTFAISSIVIPLTLWYAWSRHLNVLPAVLETVFCASMVWLLISTLMWSRNFGKLTGASSARLLLGPFPETPDEQRAWRWGRQFRYAFFAVILAMGTFALAVWLQGG